MWELRLATSHRGFSVRSIFAAALAVVIAALLWIALTPSTSYAADATWNNDHITYNDNSYTGPADSQMMTALDILESPVTYTYTEPTSTTDRKIHVIYFAPGTSPPSGTQAFYKTYRYDGVNQFSNPSQATPITVTEPGVDPDASSSDSTDNTDETTSCAVDGGLGWLICPLSNFLAAGMDNMFNILADFLEVRSLETNQESAMYRAWSFMRTFANVAFVIAFLIIIYSQLTNFGVSNYGIKKLLPRIIVAALLVNLSFIICSLAIDISNLLGYSLQNIFIEMRNSLVGSEGANWDLYTWESITSFVLAGGTAAAAGGVALFLTVSSYGVATIYLILPILLGVFLAILVALLIIAARQAIITILTILSPLAFVAYLLPNTEKWFERWRGLFMTMLIFFPAFSVVFGGSQLAGAVIIQNANSINLVVLGMAVQVAPLVITPLLLKLSGNLLGRIAGMVNNPNKGLIDRTRNWSKDRAELSKEKRLATPARRFDLLKRAGQSLDHNRRRREGWRNAYKTMSDATWSNTKDFRDIDQATRRATDEKQLGEKLSEQAYTESKRSNTEIRQLDIAVRKVNLDTSNAQIEADIQNWENNSANSIRTARMNEMTLKEEAQRLQGTHSIQYDEFKSGKLLNLDPSVEAHTMQLRAMRNADILSADALRKAAAQRVLTDQFTKKLNDNTDYIDGQRLQEYSGGIDPNGAQRAVASALSAQSRAFNESIDTAGAILISKNYSDDVINDISLDRYKGTDIVVTPEMRLAAMRKISKGGNTKEIIRLTENLDINDSALTQDFRQEIADNLLSNSSRPKWVSAGVTAAIKSGEGVPTAGKARTDEWILNAFNANKLNSADLLVSHDNEYLLRIADATRRRAADFKANPEKRADLMKQITIALTDQRYSGRLGERADTIKAIQDNLR